MSILYKYIIYLM